MGKAPGPVLGEWVKHPCGHSWLLLQVRVKRTTKLEVVVPLKHRPSPAAPGPLRFRAGIRQAAADRPTATSWPPAASGEPAEPLNTLVIGPINAIARELAPQPPFGSFQFLGFGLICILRGTFVRLVRNELQMRLHGIGLLCLLHHFSMETLRNYVTIVLLFQKTRPLEPEWKYNTFVFHKKTTRHRKFTQRNTC